MPDSAWPEVRGAGSNPVFCSGPRPCVAPILRDPYPPALWTRLRSVAGSELKGRPFFPVAHLEETQEMISLTRRLSGWARLWIVGSLAWTVFVASEVWDNRPIAYSDPYGRDFPSDFLEEEAAREVPDSVRAVWRDPRGHNERVQELAALDVEIARRVLLDSVRAERLAAKQRKHALRGLAVWLAIPMATLLAWLSAKWIWRGFRTPS